MILSVVVAYVSFGSKVRPRTFGCVAIGSAVLFIFRSRLLLYSAESEVNRVQVILSGFSVRLFGFVQAKTLCRYDCMYFLAGLVLVYVNVMVMGVFLLLFQEENKIDKKYLQKKRKTDISNTVRKRGE